MRNTKYDLKRHHGKFQHNLFINMYQKMDGPEIYVRVYLVTMSQGIYTYIGRYCKVTINTFSHLNINHIIFQIDYH